MTFYRHGFAKRGQPRSRTYFSWTSMRARCNRKNHADYKNYGGRGITVCADWNQFANFLRDMGEAPEGLTVDRIDNDKGYCKENCRWATRKQQVHNSRATRFITFNGQTKRIGEWEKYLGLSCGALWQRLRRHPLEKALSTKRYAR